MVDWGGVILGVAGSSLVLFILNTALSDYNQPTLVLDIINRSDSINSSNFREIRYDTILKNVGMTKATDVKLTIHYPSGNITNYRIVFSSENTTFATYTGPDTLVLDIDRLSPYGTIFLYTAVRDLKAPTFEDRKAVVYNGDYTTYRGNYFVSISYDQGGSLPKSTDLSLTAYSGLEKTVPFSVMVITVALVLLFILASIVNYKVSKLNKAFKILISVLLMVVGPLVVLGIAYYYYPNLF